MTTDYPRTCRNGHVLGGPEDEHVGAHRQCWRCRRATQTEADARYDAGDRGLFIRQSYELGPRMFVVNRAAIVAGTARLAEFGWTAPADDDDKDYVALSNERMQKMRALEWCDVHGKREWTEGVGFHSGCTDEE